MLFSGVELRWASPYTSSKLQAGLEPPPNQDNRLQLCTLHYNFHLRKNVHISHLVVCLLIMYFLGQLCLIRTESRPLLRPVILCFLVCGTSLPSLQIMLDLFSIPATLRQLFSGVCITAHTRLLQSSFSHPAKRMATWLVVLIMFDSTGGSLAWAGGTLVILCCLL